MVAPRPVTCDDGPGGELLHGYNDSVLSVTMTVTGLREIVEKFQQAPVQVSKSLDRAVDRSLDELAKITQNMPPVNSRANGFGTPGIPVAPLYGGTMRQSIRGRKTGF